MHSVAFVSLALALATSAMPFSVGGELRRSALPVPSLPGGLPSLPGGLPGLPGDSPGLPGTYQAYLAHRIYAPSPDYKGVTAGGVVGAAGNDLKGATNGLNTGTGKIARRDSLPDPKKVLASNQQTAGETMQEVKGEASGATGVASKGVGAAGPVGARDVISNLPRMGGLPGQAGGTVNQLKNMVKNVASGGVGSVTGSAPSAP